MFVYNVNHITNPVLLIDYITLSSHLILSISQLGTLIAQQPLILAVRKKHLTKKIRAYDTFFCKEKQCLHTISSHTYHTTTSDAAAMP